MSWDISVDAPACKECGQTRGIDVGNCTYNYSPAYHAAMGFSLDDLNGVKGAIALLALEAGHAKMSADREHYGALIKGGGTWGTIETGLDYLHRLIDACRAMPDGKISVR